MKEQQALLENVMRQMESLTRVAPLPDAKSQQ